MNDGFHVQGLQIGVGLTGADENDRLAGDVSHRNGCTNLKMNLNCIESYKINILKRNTLSSMVSNLVNTIPSMICGLLLDE